ncbi:MAG: bifunctional PIG-L family deacetylase/class I SAM-dependent methyltransferase [Microbacterium sp.]
MSVQFDHRDPGASEDQWAAVAPWTGARELELDVERLLVLAAHPDDETLGAGGLIATAADRGIPVHVMCATDGEAAYATPAGDRRPPLDRRDETSAAVRLLAADARVTFLGLPDGGLRERSEEVGDLVAAVLDEEPSRTLVVAPWHGDGHRDHRVLGEVAARFRSDRVQVLGYPIWLWHWGDPGATDTAGWTVLPLAPAVVRAKAEALRCHTSQLSPPPGAPDEPPILSSGMLAHFERRFEIFIAPPEAADPPSIGTDYFEGLHARHDDPWQTELRWYERRKRDIILASLPSPRYRRALEIGCSTGAMTARLAVRVDQLAAIDTAGTALRRASERIRGLDHVDLIGMRIPGDWPEGAFDLIVFSEIGYYLSAQDLELTLDRIAHTLTDDGVLVACHWRHAIAGAPLSGDEVHRAIRDRAGWEPIASHLETDFVLELFARPNAPSVAEREGLTP